MQPTPEIAVLWKKPDGTRCILTRRGTTLLLTVERDEQILMEKAVESPKEAMELAALWKALPNKAAS